MPPGTNASRWRRSSRCSSVGRGNSSCVDRPHPRPDRTEKRMAPRARANRVQYPTPHLEPRAKAPRRAARHRSNRSLARAGSRCDGADRGSNRNGIGFGPCAVELATAGLAVRRERTQGDDLVQVSVARHRSGARRRPRPNPLRCGHDRHALGPIACGWCTEVDSRLTSKRRKRAAKGDLEWPDAPPLGRAT